MAQRTFVEVQITLRLEVVDPAALVSAVERLEGPAVDDLARAIRAVPANCVGRLVDVSRLLEGLPGVAPAGSSVSANQEEHSS